MVVNERDVGGLSERHATQDEYNQQLWYEQELDKIRTEGDIALVRAQAEREHIAEADAKIKQLQKQLRDKKKHFTKITASSGSTIVVGDSAAIEQLSRRHELARMQLEERLKASISAKTAELHQLRLQIDEVRRQRLDGLASEKQIVEETKRSDDAIKQSQAELELLKDRAAQLRAEIATLQHEFDDEKRIFRLERQQLQLDLDRIARPEKVAVKVKVLGRKFTVFRSVAMTRKKRDALSRAKRLSLEQKVVSFEQKKILMDRLVHESETSSLAEFIQIYNRQEKEKAELMARIEAKSFLNASLQDVVTQLEEDITRLSGAGDIQSIVHMEQPNEMKKKIDADDVLIRQWTLESHAFQDALKTFRGPIRELYHELFPHERDDETFDSTANEISMLRRIGAIEERVMQRVLMKILREADASQPSSTSETLKRLQKYRGSLQSTETNSSGTDASTPLATPATHRLVVDVPSLRDNTAAEKRTRYDEGDDDDDDDGADDGGNEPIVAIRSEDFRPQMTSHVTGAARSSHA